jgi:transcriptional regulator of acetoin/glycerol metabolism
LSPNEQITIDRLPGQLWEKAKTHEVEEGATLGDVLGKVEADLLRNLLAQGYTTYQMAEKLGINQSTVVRKLQKLKIDANKNGKMP